METLKIHVQKDWGSMTVCIWAIDNSSSTKSYNLNYDPKKGITRTEIAELAPLRSAEPLLRLPDRFADILFKAIAEHLSEQGIRTDNDHKIQGKLEAKSDHLKDLQMIVKKVLKIET